MCLGCMAYLLSLFSDVVLDNKSITLGYYKVLFSASVTSVHSAEVVLLNRAICREMCTLHDGKLMFAFSHLSVTLLYVMWYTRCDPKVTVICKFRELPLLDFRIFFCYVCTHVCYILVCCQYQPF